MAKKKTPPPKPKYPTFVQFIISLAVKIWAWCVNRFIRAKRRAQNFLHRRPFRSFRPTRRRDLPKLAPLPGNIFFTAEVISMIKSNRRAFISILVIYTVVFTAIVGVLSQQDYTDISSAIKSAGPSAINGDFSKAGEVFLTMGAVVSGQLSKTLTEVEQIYVAILCLFTWLTVVWFLRHRVKGAVITVRDAIYNAGAPFVPTLVVAIVGAFQLLPGAVAVLGYMSIVQIASLSGVESMLAAIAAGLFVVMSLYWVTSTILGLIIVTIPGTYPFRALSMAGDVVIGRRRLLLVRLLWLIFIIAVVGVFILVPMILLADALPWKWLPLVPWTVQILSGAALIFSASYIYLLYRRMIDAPDPER